jgi:ATP-grasp ribosomal peptide maturase
MAAMANTRTKTRTAIIARTDGPLMRSVLVITDRYDPTANFVVAELNRRNVPVFRCDAGNFPTALSVSAELTGAGWTGRACTSRRSLDLANISGIYYRRPTVFRFPDGMTAGERRWANVQARLGFGGLLATLKPWLNHPHNIGYAEYKPVQLEAALAADLRVPRTLLTNEPHAARDFVAEVGDAVYKPFGGTAAIIDSDGTQQLFATRVSPEQAGDATVAHTMHLFQQWIPKDYEVRLTVVDGRYFAARIDARTPAAKVDWRADYGSLEYTPVDTPTPIRSRVADLLRRLGLRFGALDSWSRRTASGGFWNVTPNGQWAWIETATGMPIAAALADALEGKTDSEC